MTKDSKFVKAHYLDLLLPPIGTMTEKGKIESYNENLTVNIGGCVYSTETGTSHQDTLTINSIKLLDCKKNRKWTKK